MAFKGTLQEITVRMHGNETRDTRIEVQQGDTASRKVRIRLKTFGGADYIIPYGASAVLCIRKNDGKKVYDECDIEDEYTLLVTLSDQAISCSGLQKAQIYIFSEEGDIKTQVFQVNVPKAVYSDDAIESSDEFGILHELIVENSAIQQAEQMRIEAEATRTASEKKRQTNAATMATATEACLAVIEDARAVAYARGNAIVQTASGTSIVAQDSSDDPVRGLRVFGRTTQDGTPTPDAPVPLVSVGDAGSVEVGVYGGNLLDANRLKAGNNKTLEVLDDGYTISVTGGSNGNYVSSSYVLDINLLRGKTVYLTADSVTETNPRGITQCVINYADGRTTYHMISRSNTYKTSFVVTDDATKISIGVYSNNSPNALETDNTYTVRGLRLSIEEEVPWTPYQEGQTLSVSTPNGLPGIKVTDASLANYTDADGQMWCCDEVDLERGVYVQRVLCDRVKSSMKWEYSNVSSRFFATDSRYTKAKDNNNQATFFTGEYYNTHFSNPLCSHITELPDMCMGYINGAGYGYGYKYAALNGDIEAWKTFLDENEIYTLGILATPIETPLTAYELAQYASIRSNYPVTTVLNDSDAHMEVKYNADTKTYIDNKFAELKTALVALGGN